MTLHSLPYANPKEIPAITMFLKYPALLIKEPEKDLAGNVTKQGLADVLNITH